MIKHTKKAILSSIIQTFISNFIGENIYIKSLNKFINDNINDLNNMYKTNKEKYLTLLINKFQQLYQNSYNNFIINDISLKVLSKFTNILSILKLLYLDFSAEKLKYESIYGNVRIVRAPPVTL
ncbi:MAG: hypothetical protein WBP76_06630 [Leptotrichiaceae bacterium]|jgi:hypothetical protein|nr:hypothetical protein [Leptotrichiaceae bacterium]MBP6167620.1 hypothetical protein [Leptotrichiaceae bacterium]MBP7025733.1 hypothetical protein [Leptotrichiaceae bacterium]MBP8636702.1 hypothetical protein [Leptotrichiaceae bacterium]MBP9538357.1 hypothetical protein [Leptotrichiaceae bacterium]